MSASENFEFTETDSDRRSHYWTRKAVAASVGVPFGLLALANPSSAIPDDGFRPERAPSDTTPSVAERNEAAQSVGANSDSDRDKREAKEEAEKAAKAETETQAEDDYHSAAFGHQIPSHTQTSAFVQQPEEEPEDDYHSAAFGHQMPAQSETPTFELSSEEKDDAPIVSQPGDNENNEGNDEADSETEHIVRQGDSGDIVIPAHITHPAAILDYVESVERQRAGAPPAEPKRNADDVVLDVLWEVSPGASVSDVTEAWETGEGLPLALGLLAADFLPVGKGAKLAKAGAEGFGDAAKHGDVVADAVGPIGPRPVWTPPLDPTPVPIPQPQRRPWESPVPELPDVDPTKAPTPKPATPKPSKAPATEPDPGISPDVNPDPGGNPNRQPKRDQPDDTPDTDNPDYWPGDDPNHPDYQPEPGRFPNREPEPLFPDFPNDPPPYQDPRIPTDVGDNLFGQAKSGSTISPQTTAVTVGGLIVGVALTSDLPTDPDAEPESPSEPESEPQPKVEPEPQPKTEPQPTVDPEPTREDLPLAPNVAPFPALDPDDYELTEPDDPFYDPKFDDPSSPDFDPNRWLHEPNPEADPVTDNPFAPNAKPDPVGPTPDSDDYDLIDPADPDYHPQFDDPSSPDFDPDHWLNEPKPAAEPAPEDRPASPKVKPSPVIEPAIDNPFGPNAKPDPVEPPLGPDDYDLTDPADPDYDPQFDDPNSPDFDPHRWLNEPKNELSTQPLDDRVQIKMRSFGSVTIGANRGGLNLLGQSTATASSDRESENSDTPRIAPTSEDDISVDDAEVVSVDKPVCVDEGSDDRLNWGVDPETNAGCWINGQATQADCVQIGDAVWECPDGTERTFA